MGKALSLTDLPMDNVLRFTGRAPFLSQDPAKVTAQLAGEDLTLATASPLRDDISTDEITPVTVMLTYDERLGRYPYVGFQAGGDKPIAKDAVRTAASKSRSRPSATARGRRGSPARWPSSPQAST